jgi:hypothetical protein
MNVNLAERKELIMYELNMQEVDFVAGGAPSGTLSRPTRGESDWGQRTNDIAGMLNDFGSWLGIKVYNMVH